MINLKFKSNFSYFLDGIYSIGEGMSKLLDFSGQVDIPRLGSVEEDEKALAHDWVMVVQDLDYVIKENIKKS